MYTGAIWHEEFTGATCDGPFKTTWCKQISSRCCRVFSTGTVQSLLKWRGGSSWYCPILSNDNTLLIPLQSGEGWDGSEGGGGWPWNGFKSVSWNSRRTFDCGVADRGFSLNRKICRQICQVCQICQPGWGSTQFSCLLLNWERGERSCVSDELKYTVFFPSENKHRCFAFVFKFKSRHKSGTLSRWQASQRLIVEQSLRRTISVVTYREGLSN